MEFNNEIYTVSQRSICSQHAPSNAVDSFPDIEIRNRS